MLKNMSNF